MIVYYLYIGKWMHSIVNQLSLPTSFLSEYNYIHHIANILFSILFFIIFCANVIYWSVSKSSFSDGPEYLEMISHTIKEAVYFSLVIGAFSFVSTYLIDDEIVKNLRTQGTILIISLMYFIGISRLSFTFLGKVKSRIYRR